MASKRAYTRGLLYSALTSGILGTLSHAYHNTVLNNVEDLVKHFINESIYANYGTSLSSAGLTSLYSFAIVGTWGFGAVLGGPITNYIIERAGRKYSLCFWNNVLLFLACLCFVIARPTFRFEFLVLGRCVMGIAYSVYIISYALYITESAPDSNRGILSTFRFIFHIIACILGEVLGLPHIMGTDELWPWLLAMGFIPAFFLFIQTPLFWECPKFTYIKKGNRHKAAMAITYFHGEEVNLEEIFMEYEHEKNLMASAPKGMCGRLRETMSKRHLRIPFILTLLLNIGENTGGYDAIVNYSSDIFEKLGLSEGESMVASVLCLIPGFIGALVATYFVEKSGRRKLIFMGFGLSLIGCVLLFIFELIEDVWTGAAYGSLIGAGLIIFAFYSGLGPIPEFIFGEITPEENHSFAGGWGLAVNWGATCFYTCTFSSLHEMIGPWVQAYFILPTLLIFIYTYRHLPETKGKPVDEIIATWMEPEETEGSELDPLLPDSGLQDSYGMLF